MRLLLAPASPWSCAAIAWRDLARSRARRLRRHDRRRLDSLAEDRVSGHRPLCATIARTGALPIGVGDGVAFFARTDDAGNALDGRCTFLVSGATRRPAIGQ